MPLTFALLWLFGFAPGLSFAQPSPRWRALGPGGGGAQYQPTLSPHDPKLVVVTTDMNAGFVSEDGGGQWRRFHLRSYIRTILFDPMDKEAILALLPGTLGLYRSGDRGRTWNLVYPPPAAVAQLIFQDDEAEPYLVTRSEWPALEAFDIGIGLSSERGVLYAARGGHLDVSTDGGVSWRRLAPLAGRPIQGNSRALFAGPGGSVVIVERETVEFWDGSQMRAAAPPGLTAIREAAYGQGTLYLLTETDTLWVTRDAGRRWRRIDTGLTALSFRGAAPNLRGLATSAGHPDRVFVSYSRLAGWTGWLSGVARSDDGGVSWTLPWREGGWFGLAPVADAWITAALGVGWSENPLAIGVHPGRPDLLFATDMGRTLRSTDGGSSWQAVYSHPAPGSGGGWASSGLDVTTSYGVHFDPFDLRRLFISYTDIGLFRSEDGGASWVASSRGIPSGWANSVYWVVLDPAARGRQWAATGSTHDLPRMKMVRRGQAGWRGGVCVSSDGGRTWKPASAGLADTPITHLILDRRSTPTARTLYAAAFGAGLYKSTNDGRDWAPAHQGLASGPQPLVWRLAQDRRGALYAVVARREESLGFGNPATDGAVYRSTNDAATWERLPLPPGLNGPHGLAIDPENPDRLYLAAFGRFQPGALVPAQQGGVFVSTDAGRSWRSSLSTDQHVYDVTVDAARPNIVYAAGYQSSLWRSADRGASWVRVPGFNVKNAHRAMPDPRHPGMLFVTTYGSSVWYGPELGDPEATEEILTPAVSYKGR